MRSTSGETFDIRYEERKGYLYAFVSGDKDSLSISEAYWQAVIQVYLLSITITKRSRNTIASNIVTSGNTGLT